MNISKEINFNGGKVIYDKIETNSWITFYIIKYFKYDENNKRTDVLQFSMWDDFQFEGIPKEYKTFKMNEMKFEIDEQNPLYSPLNRFLKDDEEFILDDDNTYGINNKIMHISRDNGKINVNFYNNGEGQEEQSNLDRYKIFIKNIILDGRSKLDYPSDNNTKDRLRNLFRDIIISIAGKEELEEILKQDSLKFADDNMIFDIIPELKDECKFEQKNPWHKYDVWNHTKKALENCKPDIDMRLTLLLHDIGKPYSYQEDGNIRHFHGHAKVSEQMARPILERLGYEEDKINEICYLIKNHSTTIDVENVNKDNLEINKKLLYIQYCDASGYAPKYVKIGFDKLDIVKEKFIEKERTILEEELFKKDIISLDDKIIFTIIPELKACVGFDQKHPHHAYDVWEHTKVALEKSNRNLDIRLALLLHDIGKPHSYQEDGNVRHFHEHTEISEQIARPILKRLGYDEEKIQEICYLIKNHDTIIDVNSLDKDNIELAKRLLHIQYCDAYAHHPNHIEKRIKKLDEIKSKLIEKEKQIKLNEKDKQEDKEK